MWRRHARITQTGSNGMERRASALRRVLGALAVRQAHRVNLALVAGWRSNTAVHRRSDILDPAPPTTLVTPWTQHKVRRPNSWGRTRPIAQSRGRIGIDNFPESCITRREGPRVGVSLAGSSRSQR